MKMQFGKQFIDILYYLYIYYVMLKARGAVVHTSLVLVLIPFCLAVLHSHQYGIYAWGSNAAPRG